MDNKNNISHDHKPPLPPPSLETEKENVVRVSGDAHVLLAKACEMFLADLTDRAWLNAGENKCNTIRKADVINALASHDPCDFLLDHFHKEEPVQPVAPSDSADITEEIAVTEVVDDFTNMIEQPDYVRRVPPYYPPFQVNVMGTPEDRGGVDEAGPSGTANDGGN